MFVYDTHLKCHSKSLLVISSLLTSVLSENWQTKLFTQRGTHLMDYTKYTLLTQNEGCRLGRPDWSIKVI